MSLNVESIAPKENCPLVEPRPNLSLEKSDICYEFAYSSITFKLARLKSQHSNSMIELGAACRIILIYRFQYFNVTVFHIGIVHEYTRNDRTKIS
jgi:hypothetical protein